jgi:hypothetical protein
VPVGGGGMWRKNPLTTINQNNILF